MLNTIYDGGLGGIAILQRNEEILFVNDDLELLESINTSWGFEPIDIKNTYFKLINDMWKTLPQYIEPLMNTFENDKCYKDFIEYWDE